MPDTPENAVRFFLNTLSDPNGLKLSLAVAGARVGFFDDDEWEKARHEMYGLNVIPAVNVDISTKVIITVDTKTDDEASVSFTFRGVPAAEPQRCACAVKKW